MLQLPEFTGEPTADGDLIAAHMRRWYELHRETWWARHKPGIVGAGPDRDGSHADEFMLRLVGEMKRVIDAYTLAGLSKLLAPEGNRSCR